MFAVLKPMFVIFNVMFVFVKLSCVHFKVNVAFRWLMSCLIWKLGGGIRFKMKQANNKPNNTKFEISKHKVSKHN